MSVVWKNESALRLIALYKHHSLLWDTTNSYYKNKDMKNDAWENIAREMNLPRRDIEAKVHTLRSQFYRERKKIFDLKSTGIQQDKVISTWFAYDVLKFLVTKATTAGGKSKKQAIKHYVQLSESPDSENIQDAAPSMEVPLASPPPLLPLTSSKSSRKRTISQDEKVEDTEIKKINAKDKITNSSQDRFDVYGQYVASELREVKDEHSLVMAKYYINNILFETRMGKYRVYSTASPSANTQNTTEVDGMSSNQSGIKIENFLDSIHSENMITP